MSRWLQYALASIFLLVVSYQVKTKVGPWLPLFDIPVCGHEPLPGNNSGLQVIVSGLAKMGTRNMNHALNDIGIRSYHSEDLLMGPLREYIREETERRKAAGRNRESLGAMLRSFPEGANTLARTMSRCRVGAVTLDGIEQAFTPLVGVSPDAKIINLNWRTFEDWHKSLEGYLGKVNRKAFTVMWTHLPMELFPWLAPVQHLDSLFFGGYIARFLLEGGPPLSEVHPPLLSAYFFQINLERVWWPVREPPESYIYIDNKADFDLDMKKPYTMVSADRVLDFDMKTGTYEKLCDFLGISPCPKQGKLYRDPSGSTPWYYESCFPIGSTVNLAVRLFFAWVNLQLFFGLCSRLFGRSKAKAKTQ